MGEARRGAGALLLALAPAAAIAQQAQDEVVVTATRGPKPALEIPASIDRIEGDEVREGRPQVNLSESMGRVPGITVLNRQNYAQDLQVQSRGFGARATFGVRGIRLITDGIPATMPDGQGQASNFTLSSAERIEVLRGPFSSLYGNASGGVIVLETQDGPEIPAGELSASYGSYNTWRTGLRYGGTWGSLNAIGDLSRFETQGYRDHSAATRDQANVKLKTQIQEGTGLTLVYNGVHLPDAQDPLGLTRAQVDQNPRQAQPVAIQFNTKKTVLQNQLGAVLGHKLENGRLELMLYGGERAVEQYLAIPVATQLAATHSGGIVNLDRDYGGGALRWFGRLSELDLSIGVERDNLYERRKGYVNNNGVQGALKRDEDNTVSSTDLYAQAEWKPAERWILNAGVRSSEVKFSSADYYVVPGNGNDSGSRTYQATTPVAGVVYRASSTTSLYGNVGRGFETPTLLEIAYRNGASGLNFDLNASRSKHAELGVKSIIPQRARFTAAAFKIVTENEIVVDQNTGGRATFKNAGHTDRDGFELGAETLLGGRFEARAAYTYLRAQFREPFTTVITTTNTPVNVPAGAQLPGTARNQLYGELRYRQGPVFAALEGMHRSSVPVNDPNTEFAAPYTVLNLVGGLLQQGRGWRVTEYARVDNLADKNYVGSVIVNETNGRYYEPAPRRNMTVGVQASLQF